MSDIAIPLRRDENIKFSTLTCSVENFNQLLCFIPLVYA